MKIIKRIAFGLLVVVFVMGLGFVVWAETPLGPAPEALAALESDSQVTVTVEKFITFKPASLQPETGFIFYPGGRVDYRSYAAPLRRIAEQGYLVVLVPVRLNLAFFDINAAQPIFEKHPEIAHWVTGGHSLGGVASALFAKDNPEIEGIIFWASYPADDSLKNSDLKMLSIYGTKDMAGMEKFDETKPFLVSNANYVVIDGGNHAQFGDYGSQPGDNEAEISRADQQSQVVSAVVSFLASFAQ
ncbi:alpha/beta hydrolase [Candidatus Villigracilis saccharophilus]|uniref:alpha/beta hydrolase n=1 Tax=Candidatus Villigracilis saccharophilus TaxID=3140684 RepID=UPI003135B747|nr:alpha/beta hydrolase [Anaerolineales bacterium]